MDVSNNGLSGLKKYVSGLKDVCVFVRKCISKDCVSTKECVSTMKCMSRLNNVSQLWCFD